MPILLIDDSPEVLEVTTVLLQKFGYVVHAFENVPNALQALYNGLRPRLIILDLFMPDVGGFDLRAAQLRDEELARIPVIVLTGHDITEAEKVKLGSVSILSKPADPENLLATIRAHNVPKMQTGRIGFTAPSLWRNLCAVTTLPLLAKQIETVRAWPNSTGRFVLEGLNLPGHPDPSLNTPSVSGQV